MNGNLDFIKGLILRIDQHSRSRKGDKKIASKMLKSIKQYINPELFMIIQLTAAKAALLLHFNRILLFIQ